METFSLENQRLGEQPQEEKPTETSNGMKETEKHVVTTEPNAPVPYPQRLRQNKLDKQFTKFMEVFKKLHKNIPFVDALEHMPSYIKFKKDILSRKRRLSEFKTMNLTEEYNAILQRKLPHKMKDPGCFTIPSISPLDFVMPHPERVYST